MSPKARLASRVAACAAVLAVLGAADTVSAAASAGAPASAGDAGQHRSGTLDQLNPVPNDQLLARGVPRASLLLYPDAGHAFLFQDAAQFVPVVERFLR